MIGASIQITFASSRAPKVRNANDGIRKTGFGILDGGVGMIRDSGCGKVQFGSVRWDDEKLFLRIDQPRQRFAVSCYDYSGSGAERGGEDNEDDRSVQQSGGANTGVMSTLVRKPPMMLGRATISASKLLACIGEVPHAVELENEAGKVIGILHLYITQLK